MVMISTCLFLANKGTPEHADTLTDHCHVKLMLLSERLHDLLERRVIVKLKTIPQSPLGVPVFGLLGCDRLRESKEGQGEVNKAVLVIFQLPLAINHL